MHGISRFGRPYPKGIEYRAPEPDICDFLMNSFPRLKESDRMERMDLAKKITELYSGPGKRSFSQSKISSTFSWMYQARIIDYERFWHAKGGQRLRLWRCGTDEQIIDMLTRRPTFLDGEELAQGEVGKGDPAPDALVSKKKKCCDNPRIVKKKKSGRRYCKNCGASRKPKAVEV